MFSNQHLRINCIRCKLEKIEYPNGYCETCFTYLEQLKAHNVVKIDNVFSLSEQDKEYLKKQIIQRQLPVKHIDKCFSKNKYTGWLVNSRFIGPEQYLVLRILYRDNTHELVIATGYSVELLGKCNIWLDKHAFLHELKGELINNCFNKD